jgi:hypothetical protein
MKVGLGRRIFVARRFVGLVVHLDYDGGMSLGGTRSHTKIGRSNKDRTKSLGQDVLRNEEEGKIERN